MDPKILDTLNVIILSIFVVLVILGFARMISRYIRYKKEGLKVPFLLKRDLLLFFGLGLPFLGSLIFRALNVTVREEWWYPLWVLLSASVGLFGVAYFVYIEYFKIER